MKRILLWGFERGSLHYDVMCGVILAFMFLIPRWQFTDIPVYMRLPLTEEIRETPDRNGNPIFTVRLETPVFLDLDSVRESATDRLSQRAGKPILASHHQPIRDWRGHVVGYAIWPER